MIIRIGLINIFFMIFLFSNICFSAPLYHQIKSNYNIILHIYYVSINTLFNAPLSKSGVLKNCDYKVTIYNEQLRDSQTTFFLKDIDDFKLIEVKNFRKKTKNMNKTDLRVYAQFFDTKKNKIIYEFGLSFANDVMLVNGKYYKENLLFIKFIKRFMPCNIQKDMDEYIKQINKI